MEFDVVFTEHLGSMIIHNGSSFVQNSNFFCVLFYVKSKMEDSITPQYTVGSTH